MRAFIMKAPGEVSTILIVFEASRDSDPIFSILFAIWLRGGIIRRLGVESPVSFCYTARKLR